MHGIIPVMRRVTVSLAIKDLMVRTHKKQDY